MHCMVRGPAGLVVIAMCGFAACASSTPQQERPSTVIPSLDYTIVKTYPHDPAAFTQGLLFRDGFLYESTGLNGQSSLRKVRLETGQVLQRRDVAPQYFAEGLALAGNRLLQLTWQSNVGFIYDVDSFAPLGTFSYTGEGWGLAADGSRVIMSDGTAQLRFLDPATFSVTGAITVRDAGEPLNNLNELEVIGDTVLANVWTTDRIVRIDLATGRVTGHLDLDRLRRQAAAGHEIDVLNGIAYDPRTRRLFVTGKLWPVLFELKVEGVN